MMRCLCAVVVVLGALATVAPTGWADEQPVEAAPPLHPLSARDADALAGTLRGLLVRHAPKVLYEASPGWGQTDRVAHGLRWSGKYVPLRPHVTYGERNDGTWRRLRVTADNLADTLVFDLRDVRNAEPGRMTFGVFISFDAHADLEEQKWDDGVRLLSASARVRFRVRLHLDCEVTTRVETNGNLLPDAVFRLRVLRADLGYDNFVTEHVAGVGGEAAKVFGDAVKGSLRDWHPSLEHELLNRANAAIVKAGDTQEVRVNLVSLFNNKDQLTAPALKLLTDPKRK